jgi:hypothetical protein
MSRSNSASHTPLSRRLLAKGKSIALFGLTCFQLLFGGEPERVYRYRTPIATPMSAPFTLQDAVNLPEWNQIRRITELMKTESGSLELFHELPMVANKYTDESYFDAYVSKWRDRIPVLSDKYDSFDENNR